MKWQIPLLKAYDARTERQVTPITITESGPQKEDPALKLYRGSQRRFLENLENLIHSPNERKAGRQGVSVRKAQAGSSGESSCVEFGTLWGEGHKLKGGGQALATPRAASAHVLSVRLGLKLGTNLLDG